jgi:hypothetical protein
MADFAEDPNGQDNQEKKAYVLVSPALKDGDFGKDDKNSKCIRGVTYWTIVGCRASVLVSSLKCLDVSVGTVYKIDRKTIIRSKKNKGLSKPVMSI